MLPLKRSAATRHVLDGSINSRGQSTEPLVKDIEKEEISRGWKIAQAVVDRHKFLETEIERGWKVAQHVVDKFGKFSKQAKEKPRCESSSATARQQEMKFPRGQKMTGNEKVLCRAYWPDKNKLERHAEEHLPRSFQSGDHARDQATYARDTAQTMVRPASPASPVFIRVADDRQGGARQIHRAGDVVRYSATTGYWGVASPAGALRTGIHIGYSAKKGNKLIDKKIANDQEAMKLPANQPGPKF